MTDMDSMQHDFSILPDLILSQIIELATQDDSLVPEDKYDRKLQPNKLLLPLMGVCRSMRTISAQLFYQYAYVHFGVRRYSVRDKLPLLLDIRNILLVGCLHNVRYLAVYCGTREVIDENLLDALPEILKPGRLRNVTELRFILSGTIDKELLVPKSLHLERTSLFSMLITCAPDVRHISVYWRHLEGKHSFSTRYERERQHRYALIEHESHPFPSENFDAMSHVAVLDNVVKLVRQRAPELRSLSVRSDTMVCLQHILDRIGEDCMVFPKVIELDAYSASVTRQDLVSVEHNMFPALLHFHAARRFPFCDGTGLLNNPSGLESLRLNFDALSLQKLNELDVFRKDMYRSLKSIHITWQRGGTMFFADRTPNMFKKVVEMSPNPQRLIYCVSTNLDPTSVIDVLTSKQLVDLRCVFTHFSWTDIFKICTRVTSLRHVSFSLELTNDTISDFVDPYIGGAYNTASVRTIELFSVPTNASMRTAVENAISLAALLPTVERIVIPMGCQEYVQNLSDSLVDALAQPAFSRYTRLQQVKFDITAKESYYQPPPPEINPRLEFFLPQLETVLFYNPL